MVGLVDHTGAPLTRQVKRREMKSGQIKKTPHGDILFKLTVDVPQGVPQDDLNRYMYEYGNVIAEAYKRKM